MSYQRRRDARSRVAEYTGKPHITMFAGRWYVVWPSVKCWDTSVKCWDTTPGQDHATSRFTSQRSGPATAARLPFSRSRGWIKAFFGGNGSGKSSDRHTEEQGNPT